MFTGPFLVLTGSSLALAAATTGSFNVLSYNIAGLPALLSSGDPAKNTPILAPRLKPFNVVNVQEDFNYHAALYAGDTHAYRTPTSGGVPFGSGLNTVSDYPYTVLRRKTWDDCDLGTGDCLTPKGFTVTRIRVAEGVVYDHYNLHADAGSASGDIKARVSNFAQLAEYLNNFSIGMAVIVEGDTNARYTRAGDSETLHNFLRNAGLTDSWVKNIRGGVIPTTASTDIVACSLPFPAGTSQAAMNSCEIVDKIFTRNSEAITLTATDYKNENSGFLNSTGYPLSDHFPISSSIAWQLSSSVRLGDSVGGIGGSGFSSLASSSRITSITLRSGSRIDAISYTTSAGTTSQGGTGGTANTLTLAAGERIIEVTACQGEKDGDQRVFSLGFLTNQGRVFTGGQSTGTCTTNTIPTDAGATGAWGLVGFYGRSGTAVDMLGPIWGAFY